MNLTFDLQQRLGIVDSFKYIDGVILIMGTWAPVCLDEHRAPTISPGGRNRAVGLFN
jgi:hypothetical protein